MRILILALAWLAYVVLLFAASAMEIVGIGYFVGNIPVSEAVLASFHLAFHAAVLLAIPVLVRWKLRNATWGTFAVYAFVLGVGSLMQAVYQSLFKEVLLMWLSGVFGALSLLSAACFMYRYIQHMKGMMTEIKRQNQVSRR